MMCEDNIILSVIVQAPYTHVPLHWKNYIRDSYRCYYYQSKLAIIHI